MTKRRNYRIVGDVELPPEEAMRFEKLEAQADQEVEELRVNFRWGVQQVEMVKLAAELMGVPYQTYIKEAAYRQAVADVRASSAAQRVGRLVRVRGWAGKADKTETPGAKRA